VRNLNISEQEKTEKDSSETDIVKELEARIVKHFLDVVVLAEIKNKSGLGGYDIIALVHNKFGTLMSSGTVYSVLYAIERRGWVKGLLDGRRTGYVLTEKGEEALSAIQKSRNELAEFMKTFFSF
jgi:DNA-binding PadR family transcriptional regulator